VIWPNGLAAAEAAISAAMPAAALMMARRGVDLRASEYMAMDGASMAAPLT
jgi:hypothetical protein